VNAILSGADDTKGRNRETGQAKRCRQEAPEAQGMGRLTGRLPKPQSTAAISATSQSRSVTPAATAGVTLSVRRTAVRCASQKIGASDGRDGSTAPFRVPPATSAIPLIATELAPCRARREGPFVSFCTAENPRAFPSLPNVRVIFLRIEAVGDESAYNFVLTASQ
jgi:hypothetical protein